MEKIPYNYKKLESKQITKNVTSFRNSKDKRDPLNAAYAFKDQDKYRKSVRFDGGTLS